MTVPDTGGTDTDDVGAPPLLRDRAAVIVVGVGTAVGLLYCSWYLVADVVGPEMSRVVVDRVSITLEWSSALLAGVLLLGVAARRRGTDRWSWALFGTGVTLWSIGSMIWAAYVFREDPPPSPGPMDLFYLCLPVAMAAGMIIRGSDRRTSTPLRDVVDGLLAAASILLILWVGLLRVTVLSGTPSEILVNLAYPVGDVAIIVLLLGMVGRRSDPDRLPLVLLTLGLGSIAIADLSLLALSAHGIYDTTPTFTDAPWTVGFVIMAGAAWVARRRPTVLDHRQHQRAPQAGAAPIAAASVALVVGLVDLSLRRSGVPWTIPMLIVIVGLLLARQSLTLTEIRRLSDDLARNVRQLAHQADHDRLTGLPNRSTLAARLDEAIRSSGDSSWSAVVFADIDHLKPVNDSLGHDRGDELIRTVAARLRESCGDAVTRFGGDEFVVLLQGRGDRAAMERRAQALVDDVSRPVDLGGLTVQPSVSVGIAVAEPGSAPEELLRRADTALYRAKAAGRRRAVVYDRTMDADSLYRVEIEPLLRRALAEDEFEIHYQPVVELLTGRLLGAEALLRWRHPTEGLLLPDQFLQEADALGLLGAIGDRTLHVATRRFAEVNARPGQAPVRVAVNLSASELATTEAVDRVSVALSTSGLAPDLLILEIREDVVVDDSTRRTIDQLCALGVGIAIDDFGTGNSSLRQLGSYPASILKVDRSFVDGLGTEQEDTFIVRALLNLARNLGLQTVAEGVETAQQLRMLVELGCDAGQGWYFDRALPFDQFDRLHLLGATTRRLRTVT